MKIKLMNHEIVSFYEGLLKFREKEKDTIPVKIGFKIIKNMKTIQPIYESIMSLRNEILKRYGKLKEETGEIYVPKENVGDANKDLKNLFDIITELEIDPIPLDWIEELSFSLEEIDALFLLVEQE